VTETPRWFLDELAHAGDEHLDPAYVEIYDRKVGADPAADIALLRRLGLDQSRTLVDFGAGTGTFVLAAAPLCRRAVAVDVSSAMLASLRESAARLALENVECAQGGFLTYEHRGDPADFVYSRNVLHHLPDFWKALALQRVAAVLRPGGVLRLRDLIFSFDPRETVELVEAWLRGAAPDGAVGFTRSELEAHLRCEYSTFAWLLEPMLERAGLRIDEAEYAPSKIYAAYVCTKTGGG
jgi:SAM-dependent methyltransferase